HALKGVLDPGGLVVGGDNDRQMNRRELRTRRVCCRNTQRDLPKPKPTKLVRLQADVRHPAPSALPDHTRGLARRSYSCPPRCPRPPGAYSPSTTQPPPQRISTGKRRLRGSRAPRPICSKA